MSLVTYQMQGGALVDLAGLTPPPAAKQLYLGASPGYEELDALDAKSGFKTQLSRRYSTGFPSTFPLTDVGKRATIFSFKPLTGSGGEMDQIIAGSGAGYTKLNQLIDSIPAGHPTWLCLWHEPEDNFQTTTARTQYKAAWNKMADVIHGKSRPELKTCWIMTATAWVTANTFQYGDYLVDMSKVDAIGFDVYNDGSLRNPQRWDTLGLKLGRPDPTESLSPIGGSYTYTGGCMGFAADQDKPVIITEWGSIADHAPATPTWCTNAGIAATRPAWITYTTEWLHEQPEIIGATYFNASGRTWAGGDGTESWELYHDGMASYNTFGAASNSYAAAKGLLA